MTAIDKKTMKPKEVPTMADIKDGKEIFEECTRNFPNEAYHDVGNGAQSFTTIDAYHIIGRMTSIFGLCGVGWGWGELTFSSKLSEQYSTRKGDPLHYAMCVGSIWYMLDGEKREIFAVGDANIAKDNIAEGYKKAQTNLLSKATSFMGMGLSVYQGKGMDDPYLDRMKIFRYQVPTTTDNYDAIKKWLSDQGCLLNEDDGDKILYVESNNKLHSKMDTFKA